LNSNGAPLPLPPIRFRPDRLVIFGEDIPPVNASALNYYQNETLTDA
jgi:hypothetical protein